MGAGMSAAGREAQDEERVRAERARAVGLFRYALVRAAADASLTTRQRGRLVRALVEREHARPFGEPVRVSRATLDRWIRDWRRCGLEALVPSPRRIAPRTPTPVLELSSLRWGCHVWVAVSTVVAVWRAWR